MSSTGIWAELGIGPTNDAAAVRRAYAARLKVVRPDADPQGFARLRRAYETALAAAQRLGPATGAPTLAVPLSERSVTPMPAAAAAAPPDGITQHLRGGNPVAAAEWLLTARGTLTLQDAIRLADRLGWALVHDRQLPAEAVRAAAERLGWSGANQAGAWAKPLQARLDAEAWLHRDLTSFRLGASSRNRSPARILLGRGPLGRFDVSLLGRPTLARRYGEYLLHAPAVAHHFDPARIASISQRIAQRPKRAASLAIGLPMAALVAYGFGIAVGERAPELQLPASIGLFITIAVPAIWPGKAVLLTRIGEVFAKAVVFAAMAVLLFFIVLIPSFFISDAADAVLPGSQDAVCLGSAIVLYLGGAAWWLRRGWRKSGGWSPWWLRWRR